MEIYATWQPLVLLRSVGEGYDLDFDDIPEVPAVYMIVRRHSDNTSPIYIGRTAKLQRRMRQHFDSRKFMGAIANSKSGSRYLVWCTFQLRPGQRLAKVMGLVERGLITHALTEGHPLVNIKGTKTPADTVHFSGNLDARGVSGKTMLVRR